MLEENVDLPSAFELTLLSSEFQSLITLIALLRYYMVAKNKNCMVSLLN